MAGKLELCLERDDASIWKREGYFWAFCPNCLNAKVPVLAVFLQLKTPNAN